MARTEERAGNILKSIAILEFTSNKVVELDDYTYITKSNIKYMSDFLAKGNWQFDEQLGAAYSFENSEGDRMLLISRYVFGTRYFILESTDRIVV